MASRMHGRAIVDALRCHFAVAGPGEVEAVCGPVVELRADKLFLFRRGTDDEGARTRDLIRERLRREAETRRNNATEVTEVDVDLRHPAAIAHAAGSIVDESPGMNYRFNLSVGPREAAWGGVLACTFWSIAPYVVKLDPERRVENPEEGQFRYASMLDMPRFPQEKPRGESLALLSWLADAGKPVPQVRLIARLAEEGHIAPKRKDKLSPQAKQAQFGALVRRLVELGLVRQVRSVGAPTWELTDGGRVALALFRGLPLP